MGIAKNRAERIGSTVVQIGSTKLVPNADNDIEVKDTSDVRKKVIASELRVGTGNDIVIVKRDSSTGKVKFETSSDGGGSSTEQSIGGSAIYTNPSDLPVSGNSAGDMAFITSTNNLMIHNGSGWYKVATVTNASPTISSAGNASYSFATDGTPVSIEVTASDPEGIALQYKYVVSSGSIGSTAAVTSSATSGGTYSALNANTLTSNKYFKVTPSTNEAHAGSFSLTFSAYDGINTATSSASSFTLAFDVSGSYKFDGNGDAVTVPASADFSFGTGDFTIEGFVRSESHSNYPYIYDGRTNPSASSNAPALYIHNDNTLKYYVAGSAQISTDYSSYDNKFTHIVVQRNSGTTTLFLDGVSKGTWSDSTNYTDQGPVVLGRHGDSSNATYCLNGYMSNVRIVKGSAAYNVTTISGGSTLFDGTDDNLSIPSFVVGTNDYTIEMWIYPTAISNYYHLYDGRGGSSGDAILLQMTNTGTFRFYSQTFRISGSTQVSVNTWNHIVLERVGNINTIYVNGTSDGTYNDGGTSYVGPANGVGRIGSDDAGSGSFFPGYISNFRIVIGSAVYNGNFTPPNSTLTAISNTQLLTCQNSTGSITDASSNNHTITANGGAAASTQKPFADTITVPTADLSAITNTKLLALTEKTPQDLNITNGSYNFTTISSRLTATDSGFNWSDTDPFTYEMWYKFTGRSNGDCMFDFGAGNTFQMYVYNNQVNIYGLGGGFVIQYGSAGYALDTWYHAAITGDGSGNIKAYIDGQQVGSTYASPGFNITGSKIRLNGYAGSGYTNVGITGFYSDIRFVNGTQVYTGNFTPPSGPLTTTGGTYPSNTNVNTSITASHTKILTAQNSSGALVDNSTFGHSFTMDGTVTPSAGVVGAPADLSSSSHTLSLIGDTAHSYATPFEQGSNSSILFDGSGDYLTISNSQNFYNLGTADWTIEFWVYFTDVSVFNGIFQIGEDVGALSAMLYTDGKLKLLENDQAVVFESNTTFQANKWYHIAFTNDDSSNTQRLYINGAAAANTGSKSTAYSFGNKTVYIGGRYFSGSFQRDMNGYISNFRIVGGSVVYPPASGGGSAYFDGNGDYITTNTTNDLIIGSNSFTAECWIHPTSFAAVQGVVDRRRGGDPAAYDWTTYLNTDNTLNFYANGGTRITSSALSTNQWYHTAVVRNSGTTTLYVDGVSQGTYSDSNSYPSNQMTFGIYGPGLPSSLSLPYSGYISNFRLEIGTNASNGAVYTTAFTPPTSALTSTSYTELMTFQNYTGSISDEGPNGLTLTEGGNVSSSYSSPFIYPKSALTAITNTQLLTCQNSTDPITDASSNGYTITANGNVVATRFSPFEN